MTSKLQLFPIPFSSDNDSSDSEVHLIFSAHDVPGNYRDALIIIKKSALKICV